MILTSRKLNIFEELGDFTFYLKEEVKVLALSPGTLRWKASCLFLNNETDPMIHAKKLRTSQGINKQNQKGHAE